MEAIFVALVMGCSDDFSLCDRVATLEVSARSAEACAELVLSTDEVTRLDYPAARVECDLREGADLEVADASR